MVGTEWRNLTIVRAHTDDGLTGLGEARMVNHTEALVGYLAEAALRSRRARPVQDRGAGQEDGPRRLLARGEVMSSGIAMFETALGYRWQGARPALSQLLGGPVRDRVKAYANGWYRVERTPEEFHELR